MLFPSVKMFFILVVYISSRVFEANCDTVSSPHIRILDVATKSSETRLFPHRVDYQSGFHPKYQQSNWYERNQRPLKSYVIYDEYPVKIFKEWRGDGDLSVSRPPFLLELNRHPDAELTPDYYLRNRPQVLPPPKPTLAYHSVYSNVIKVFDDSLEGFGQSRFQNGRLPRPYDGGGVWKSFRPPLEYDPDYSQDASRAPYHDEKLPDNFPKIFSPNSNFHFGPFNMEEPKPPKPFGDTRFPQRGYYDTHTVNYNEGGKRRPEDVEFLPEIETNEKNQKVFLCSFIRLNQKQFPESGGPCSRSEDNLPILAPEYPDYSKLPNEKIPVEHRRQHYQMKRIKRSEHGDSRKSRQKRASGFGYGYGSWGSPLSYEGSYEGYLSDYYPNRGGYGSFGSNYGNGNGYYRNNGNGNRNRYQRYRNRYYGGNRSNYDDYDDEYQSNDDSNSKGLSSYLTSGGRRYKNRKNNDNDNDNDDDDNDNDDEDNDNNNNNNNDDDSEEEMERQNSGRGSNDRRNNDDSRDRRRNNNNNNSNNNNNNNNNNNGNGNNNDDDDSRDNRRNNNRQYSNSRRNNKRYNDRNNYNNRNRNDYGSNSGYGFGNGYGNSNGYGNNNGYGSSNGYGGYGNSNGGYGSSFGSNNGYGSSGSYGNNGYGSSGGYGNGYSSRGGFGYGNGYGNGFSSI